MKLITSLKNWIAKNAERANSEAEQESLEMNDFEKQIIQSTVGKSVGGQSVNRIFVYPPDERRYRVELCLASIRGEEKEDIFRLPALAKAKMEAMSMLNLRFARVVKSSQAVAELVYKDRLAIETKPHSLCINPTPKLFPMAFTEERALLTCMEYGDQIALLSFDADKVKAYGLEDEPVWYRGGSVREYDANTLIIEDILDLHKSSTLVYVIQKSDPSIFAQCADEELGKAPYPEGYKVAHYLNRFGCTESRDFWNYLVEVYENLGRGKAAAEEIINDVETFHERFAGREYDHEL